MAAEAENGVAASEPGGLDALLDGDDELAALFGDGEEDDDDHGEDDDEGLLALFTASGDDASSPFMEEQPSRAKEAEEELALPSAFFGLTLPQAADAVEKEAFALPMPTAPDPLGALSLHQVGHTSGGPVVSYENLSHGSPHHGSQEAQVQQGALRQTFALPDQQINDHSGASVPHCSGGQAGHSLAARNIEPRSCNPHHTSEGAPDLNRKPTPDEIKAHAAKFPTKNLDFSKIPLCLVSYRLKC
jgi:hypothetical protein